MKWKTSKKLFMAISVLSYFEREEVSTRHKHSLSYRKIRTRVGYYQYSFFPMAVVI